jgi:DNA transformation protein
MAIPWLFRNTPPHKTMPSQQAVAFRTRHGQDYGSTGTRTPTMSTSQDYLDYLTEHLTPLGPVSARRMFGGAGLFIDGLMFALVIDEVLYFKTDDETRAAFDAEGLKPFTYTRSGEVATLTNYRRAPERLLDETDELVSWSRQAVAVARRANASKRSRPARPPKPDPKVRGQPSRRKPANELPTRRGPSKR